MFQPPNSVGPRVDPPAGRPSLNQARTPNPPVAPQPDLTSVGTPAAGGAPSDLAGNQVLANILRGSDGSAWYLRKEQSKVTMFGEHPGKKYATVFEGTLNGQLINGQYWDCPKGTRTLRGQLQLQVQNNGDTLRVNHQTGGLDIVELNAYAIDNDQLPRADRAPGFSSTSVSDLDGAWRNGGVHLYLREVDGRIVGWMEKSFQRGQKPELARVAFGTRQNDGRVSFQLISLPKGHATGSVNETYLLDDAFHLRRLGGATLVRDSVDIARMAEEIDKRFKNRCVGFGYAIAQEGAVVKTGGGGRRFLPMDGFDMAFDADTQKDTQSTAKTITAVAVLHLLNAKGMDVDDRIVSWLPKTWKKGAGVESLTFKHLLTHKSGLVGNGDPDEYENLKKTIETGPVNMNWIVPAFDYQNCNFALFRLLIPYLENRSEMHNFEDNGLSGATINERCSDRYIEYVRDHVLLPSGLENPQPTYTSSNIAYSYNFQNQNVAGYPQQANQRYEGGAGGWVVSARDYVKFLAALDNGVLLATSQVAQMKSERLGIFATGSAIGNVLLSWWIDRRLELRLVRIWSRRPRVCCDVCQQRPVLHYDQLGE